MEDCGCWADDTPAAKGALHWMEPYQLDAPGWGVVDRRLRMGENTFFLNDELNMI